MSAPSGTWVGVANKDFKAPEKDPGRWRIACINWSHATAPKAVAYYINGAEFFDRYFLTWAEAVAWTDEILRKASRGVG